MSRPEFFVSIKTLCKRQDSNLVPYYFQPDLLPTELRRRLAAAFVNYRPGASVAAIDWPNYSLADFCSREVDASVDCFTIDCQPYGLCDNNLSVDSTAFIMNVFK